MVSLLDFEQGGYLFATIIAGFDQTQRSKMPLYPRVYFIVDIILLQLARAMHKMLP